MMLPYLLSHIVVPVHHVAEAQQFIFRCRRVQPAVIDHEDPLILIGTLIMDQ